jgi:hypothetical protein
MTPLGWIFEGLMIGGAVVLVWAFVRVRWEKERKKHRYYQGWLPL